MHKCALISCPLAAMSRTEITILNLPTPLNHGEDVESAEKRHGITPDIVEVDGHVLLGWNDEVLTDDSIEERMQWLIEDSNWEDLEILARLARLLDGYNTLVVTSKQLSGRP